MGVLKPVNLPSIKAFRGNRHPLDHLLSHAFNRNSFATNCRVSCVTVSPADLGIARRVPR